MSEGRYNIPKKYKIDRGMPVELINQRIDNEKCRQVFDSEIEKMTWCYQITDENISDAKSLMRAKGISMFEVVMKNKISTELMTEVISTLIPKRFIIMYICDGELAIGTYIPAEGGVPAKMSVTDFYPYDEDRMIEILDFEQDSNKSVAQIHARFLQTVRYQRKMIMIEKAFESMSKKVKTEEKRKANDSILNFDIDEINRIREEARFVQQQLTV